MKEKIDRQALNATLDESLARIDESIAFAAEAAKPVELDQQRQGRLSRMDALQQQEMSKANLERLHVEKNRLLAAKNRLATDEYGVCVVCDAQIEMARLAINPSIIYCKICMKRV